MAEDLKYERATGVEEHLRQCMDCKKYFRSTTDETLCPHCGSERTRDTRESAGMATGRRLNTVVT